MMPRSRDNSRKGKPHLRSRSRERDRSPLRGPGDSPSDPGSANARMFGGSIPPAREVLDDHFSRWGNNNDDKPGKIGSGQSGMPPGLGSGIPGSSDSWGGPRGGSYSHERDHSSSRSDPYYDSYYRSDSKGRDEPSGGGRYGDYYRDYYDREGRDTGGNGYYQREAESVQSPRSYGSVPYSSPAEPLDPLDPSRPNDVEIVVPNKLQRAYAESIEIQLKRIGLLVDLLFPPPDISPARVIGDLTARRCLYAVFATVENEKHNSITLNILHGEPQEHRNMPVDDAMRLIQQNFEDYVKKSRMRNMREVVPRDVRNLLHDMLEMRPLSMGDLDKLIKYLRERQNALVDDQIEQKREIAGNQSSAVAGSMAVTYPGYNYLATPGATVTGAQASHSNVGAAHGIMPGVSGPVNIATSPNPMPQVAAAYPATAYSGMSATGMIGAYGVSNQMAVGHPTGQIAPGNSAVVAAGSKQSELQERILSLMTGQGLSASGMAAPSAVPPPTGVPAPTGVPPPRMVQQPMWMSQPSRANESSPKIGQSSQAAYNPWSQ